MKQSDNPDVTLRIKNAGEGYILIYSVRLIVSNLAVSTTAKPLAVCNRQGVSATVYRFLPNGRQSCQFVAAVGAYSANRRLSSRGKTVLSCLTTVLQRSNIIPSFRHALFLSASGSIPVLVMRHMYSAMP